MTEKWTSTPRAVMQRLDGGPGTYLPLAEERLGARGKAPEIDARIRRPSQGRRSRPVELTYLAVS